MPTPMSLALMLVAAASLAGASSAAPNMTLAGHQAMCGLSAPAESVETICLHVGTAWHDGAHDAGSLVGAQHTAEPPLPPHGATHSPAHASPTAEDTKPTKDIADDKTPSYKTTYHKTPFTCAGASARPPTAGECRVDTSTGATDQNAGAEATTTTTTPAPRMCPANRAGELTELNHLFGAPHRLTPFTPARVDLATPGVDTTQDATEPPPSVRSINTKNTVNAGAAATGGCPPGAPPDTLAPARARASEPQHLHAGHQDLPPEDSVTTTNKPTAKIVGRCGSTVLPSARDDDDKVEVS